MSCREGADETTGDSEGGEVEEGSWSWRRSWRRVQGVEMCLLHKKEWCANGHRWAARPVHVHNAGSTKLLVWWRVRRIKAERARKSREGGSKEEQDVRECGEGCNSGKVRFALANPAGVARNE